MAVDALADGGVKMGLPRRLAVRLGAQALLVSTFPLACLGSGCEVRVQRVDQKAAMGIGQVQWVWDSLFHEHLQYPLPLLSLSAIGSCQDAAGL